VLKLSSDVSNVFPKVLKLSSEVSECKPLPGCRFRIRPCRWPCSCTPRWQGLATRSLTVCSWYTNAPVHHRRHLMPGLVVHMWWMTWRAQTLPVGQRAYVVVLHHVIEQQRQHHPPLESTDWSGQVTISIHPSLSVYHIETPCVWSGDHIDLNP